MASAAADRHGGVWRSLLISAGFVLVADQVTKFWATEALVYGSPRDVVWKLRWTLSHNDGASFSLGDGSGPLIGVAVIVILGGILWFARSLTETWAATALGAVLGGAVGNLLDRVFRADDGVLSGAVVDFIDFQFWPIFNVGDMGIVLGSIALVLGSWLLGDPAGGGQSADDVRRDDSQVAEPAAPADGKVT